MGLEGDWSWEVNVILQAKGEHKTSPERKLVGLKLKQGRTHELALGARENSDHKQSSGAKDE